MFPFFSIVIPTFNRVELIGQTINSVLDQTFNNFEIIIVDDGSSDDTANFIQTLYSHDERVRYFYKINEERGAARNYGFIKSQGEFVVFLDSDDLLMQSHLNSLYKVISNDNSIKFITTKYKIKKNDKYYPSDLTKFTEGFYDINIVINGNPFACNFAVKRKNPNIILFREERDFIMLEDWVFLVENLMLEDIYIINEITIIMRDHNLRSMHGNQSKIIKARLFSLNWLIDKYNFNCNQKSLITGHSYYFCAVHNYIDGNIITAYSFLLKYIKIFGFDSRSIILGIKLIIGRSWIDRLVRIVKN